MTEDNNGNDPTITARSLNNMLTITDMTKVNAGFSSHSCGEAFLMESE